MRKDTRKTRRPTRRATKKRTLGQVPVADETTTLGLVPVVSIEPIFSILPSPENDLVYTPVQADDPAFIGLRDSILANGMHQPILSTRDRFILSGHRRHAAAVAAGLSEVPVQFVSFSREDDIDYFVTQLVECNRQRVKTFSETVRETVLTINPLDAYEDLVVHRKEKSEQSLEAMTLNSPAKRCRITDAKKPFLDAILAVLEDRRDYWPITLRSIHYSLLNNPPLRHALRKKSIYRNNKDSYKSLSELVTRARLTGEIPDSAIDDATRPIVTWHVFQNPAPFIQSQCDDLFRGYFRNLMQSQPCHIEIYNEKDTIHNVLKTVAAHYCIPLTTMRGYCSLPPREKMAERFLNSGKDKLVLLAFSDFDPDGQVIASSFAQSLKSDFHIANIHAVKVAINAQQVQDFNLPPKLEAKETSSHYDSFTGKFGKNVFELEALHPKQLQQLLREAIDSVIDVEAFNHEQEQERQDAAKLQALRHTTMDALKGVDLS